MPAKLIQRNGGANYNRPAKTKSFLADCVSVPAFAAMHGHLPEWAYRQIEKGLPAITDQRPVLIHVPTANAWYAGRQRSRGRKLAAA